MSLLIFTDRVHPRQLAIGNTDMSRLKFASTVDAKIVD
jgi:hypothetical protein